MSKIHNLRTLSLHGIYNHHSRLEVLWWAQPHCHDSKSNHITLKSSMSFITFRKHTHFLHAAYKALCLFAPTDFLASPVTPLSVSVLSRRVPQKVHPLSHHRISHCPICWKTGNSLHFSNCVYTSLSYP